MGRTRKFDYSRLRSVFFVYVRFFAFTLPNEVILNRRKRVINHIIDTINIVLSSGREAASPQN